MRLNWLQTIQFSAWPGQAISVRHPSNSSFEVFHINLSKSMEIAPIYKCVIDLDGHPAQITDSAITEQPDDSLSNERRARLQQTSLDATQPKQW